MNTAAAMIEEVYTSTDGVSGITYAWFQMGAGVSVAKTEWTQESLYTTHWAYPTMTDFNTYLEGQHEMHLQNGWTHVVFS